MSTFIEIIKAIIYGIVEGVTEWLPISSTGHMILLQSVMPLNVSDDFWKMFEVVIQLGAIIAVIILFFNKLWPFKRKNSLASEKDIAGERPAVKGSVWKPGALLMWAKIIAACIPAAVVGLLFDDKINELFYNPISVAIALIVVGLAFIVVESTLTKGKNSKTRRIADISWLDAIIVGIFQVFAAVFPGTSRSGATIIGGLIIGMSRKTAAEFTFFLAVPVMAGASLLKAVKFIKAGISMTGVEAAVLVSGTFTAFIVSLLVIRFLMDFIRKHDFKVFGYYRIALGALVLFCGALGFIA